MHSESLYFKLELIKKTVWYKFSVFILLGKAKYKVIGVQLLLSVFQ